MADLPTWLPPAAALALALLLVVLVLRRRSRASAGADGAPASSSLEAALRREERFGALELEALVARMRAEPGPLTDAIEAARDRHFAEAKRRLEHPDVDLAWSAFPEHGWALACARLGVGSPARALLAARKVVEIPGLEPRHLAQGWSVVRELGGSAPEEAGEKVLGVVVETEGETVAAWADGEAEFDAGDGNAAGPLREPEIGAAARELVHALAAAADAFVPAETPAPPVAAGGVRYTLLTPAGPRVAEVAATVARAQPAGEAVLRLRYLLREHTREVARIAVTRGEEILLNDQPTTLDALRGDLVRLRDAGGRVWLHRPNPHRDPSPTAHAVFAAVIEHGLPVTLTDADPAESDATARAT